MGGGETGKGGRSKARSQRPQGVGSPVGYKGNGNREDVNLKVAAT